MIVLQRITLDLIDCAVPVVVNAKQYDENTRIIEAQLTAGGVPFQIGPNAVGVFQLRKPDGTFCVYDSDEENDPAVFVDGDTVQVKLVAAALSAAGDGYAQIDLYDGEGKLTSFTFILRIQESTVPDGAISEDYINILTSLINRAESAAEDAFDYSEAAAESAENAAQAARDAVQEAIEGGEIGEEIDTKVAQAVSQITAESINAAPLAHVSDTTMHTTSAEKSAWNGHIADSEIHLTQEDRDKIDNAFTALDAVSDFDTATTPGMYYAPGGTPNAPTTGGYMLSVFVCNGRGTQIATINGSSSNMYIRSMMTGSGGGWQTWRKIITADMFSVSGATLTITTT